MAKPSSGILLDSADSRRGENEAFVIRKASKLCRRLKITSMLVCFLSILTWFLCVLLNVIYDSGRVYVASGLGGAYICLNNSKVRPPQSLKIERAIEGGISFELPSAWKEPNGDLICIISFFWISLAAGVVIVICSLIEATNSRKSRVVAGGFPVIADKNAEPDNRP